MPTFRLLAVAAAVLWAATQATQAWDESGHLKIAALAYDELSDAGRVAADIILTNHLKYPGWAAEYADYKTRTTDNREVSLGFYVFIRAAVWPDEIRDYNRPETHAYWHFVTYPLIF